MKENKELLSLLKKLISLRSDVDLKSEINESEISDFIYTYLKSCDGWFVNREIVDGERSNIIAVRGSVVRVVYVGHLDTVSVTSLSQLRPKLVQGRLYGRGAVDMKAGIAILLQLAKQSKLTNCALVFTIDEEYDFVGIREFINRKNNWNPEIVINLEPTNCSVLQQCRGIAEMQCLLRGKSAHAGNKEIGVNAVEGAVSFCKEWESKIRSYDEQNLKSSLNLAGIQGGVWRDGSIKTCANLVPDAAFLTIEARLGSQTLTPVVLEKLAIRSASVNKVKIESFTNKFWLGPMVIKKEKGELFRTFMDAVNLQRLPKKQIDPNKSGFFEVKFLQDLWECPIVVFGPGPAKMAHTINEYVSTDQIYQTFQVFVEWLESFKTIDKKPNG